MGDLELAVALPSLPALSACPAADGETATASPGLAGGQRWLEVLNRLAGELLGQERPDVGRCVDDLVAALGADGAALGHWIGGEELELDQVAGAAPPTGLSELRETLAAVRDASRREGSVASFLIPGNPPLSLAAAADPSSPVRFLVVWGAFPLRAASGALLEVVLRLVLHSGPERLTLAAATDTPPPPELAFPAGMVIGRSAAMARVFDQVRQLVAGDIPVLVTGETGVGKDLVARTLHASSPRAAGPFQVVHCAAIPSDLLEAELFGIEKGVATGVVERPGSFQLAAGGVVFLDEIGDMPLPLQGKLLRVLQSKEVQPVGAPRPVPVDVRVIAATNRDLDRLMAEGGFRRDLYYRVAGYLLVVPPLRGRREDIPTLVAHFLRNTCAEVGKNVRGITVRAMRSLVEATWPGNVRELEHEVRRLVYLCPPGRAIESSMLSPSVLMSGVTPEASPCGEEESFDLEARVASLERQLIAAALARSRGNRSRAARLLGLSRNGLLAKMQRHGLEG
jgi:transcriptional regulator with GAF, ATPase, and Fis domain